MDVSQLRAGGTQMSQPMTGASGNWSAPPQQKMADLFSKIDSTNTGSISQTQFGEAFETQRPPRVFQEAGAAAVWSALDPQGTGQVSRADFISTMKNLMVELRNPTQNAAGGTGNQPTDPTASQGTDAVNGFYI